MSGIFPDDPIRRANDKRPAFEITQEIVGPDAEWFKIKDFQLHKIPAMFVPAPFQRDTSTVHVYRIVESIINNKFYDNFVRCSKLGNGKYQVIDGQHRLQALWKLHKQYGLEKYPIVLQLFKPEEAREVFRKINSGKGLTTANHLKTLDDNMAYENFFGELRDYCVHSNAFKAEMPFIKILHALSYARKHLPKPVKMVELEEILESVKVDEIAHLCRFARAAKEVFLKFKTNHVFHTCVYRPIFRIGMEENLSYSEYVTLFSKAVNDDIVVGMLKERFSTHHIELYNRMKILVRSIVRKRIKK